MVSRAFDVSRRSSEGRGLRHTKSSPIGPAEHDDGGSLYARLLVEAPDNVLSLIERFSKAVAGWADIPPLAADKKAFRAYRPRSVSSLLIRFRAMTKVWMNVDRRVGRVECGRASDVGTRVWLCSFKSTAARYCKMEPGRTYRSDQLRLSVKERSQPLSSCGGLSLYRKRKVGGN